jgi:hypothetical protein
VGLRFLNKIHGGYKILKLKLNKRKTNTAKSAKSYYSKILIKFFFKRAEFAVYLILLLAFEF